jgi:hypothetical protein
MLCLNCLQQGYCRKKTIAAVSDCDINNPAFVAGCRIVIGRLLPSKCDLLEFIADLYRDAELTILDEDGNEFDFDLEVLNFPELRHWLDYTFRKPLPTKRRPHVRCEAWLRFKTVVSIYRAAYPDEFAHLVAANDNEAP